MAKIWCFLFSSFRILFIYFQREGKRGKHTPVASCTPPTGYLAHNLGMCPDWGSNQRPFSSQAGTQPTEPYMSQG